MNVVTRGMRNAFRNITRTVAIVFILGLSIGLSLVMLIANQAVEGKIKSTLSAIGNTVNISPVGFMDGSSVNNTLTSTQLAKLTSLPHVSSVAQLLTDHIQTEGTTGRPTPPRGAHIREGGPDGPADDAGTTTNLKSPFALKCTNGNCSGGGVSISGGGPRGGGNPTFPDNFSLPISVIGTTRPLTISATSLKIVSGTAIDGGKDTDDAMISKAMADKNGLTVGSTFRAYDKTFKVAAIYEADTQAGNSNIVMSLPTLQRIKGEPGAVTDAVATIDSLENLASATEAIRSSLGSDADVTSSLEEARQAIEPLQSVRNISFYSLIGSVGAGSVIILLVMIMIVRERKREIGVAKAIGASNVRIILQFMFEALTLTTLGAVIGVVIGTVGASPVTAALVGNGAHSLGGPESKGDIALLDQLTTIQATVGWPILLEGFGAALLIAIVGSVLAAALIAKVRPSEVLRSE